MADNYWMYVNAKRFLVVNAKFEDIPEKYKNSAYRHQEPKFPLKWINTVEQSK